MPSIVTVELRLSEPQQTHVRRHPHDQQSIASASDCYSNAARTEIIIIIFFFFGVVVLQTKKCNGVRPQRNLASFHAEEQVPVTIRQKRLRKQANEEEDDDDGDA